MAIGRQKLGLAWRWAGLVAMLIGAVAVGNVFVPQVKASSHGKLGFQLPGAPGDETTVLPLPDKPSIAVLAFTNMSGDPEQEYFADGMAEDIITDLSKISGLLVISRSSSFAYKGKSPDLRAVGRELGVKFVLEGSVQRRGETLRITAQLVDTLTGGHVWADRFDGKFEDVFALQDQLTQRIVTALAVQLTSREQERVAERETDSIEAYDAFIKGWGHYRRRTPDDFAAAIPYFKRAIELDPDYGRAYAALATIYWRGASTGWSKALGAPFTTLIGRARDNLEKAIEKKPTSFAYRLTATMKLRQRRYDEALADAERAVSLDPDNADALTALAGVLTTIGRPEEAIGFAERAMRVDPVFPGVALIQIGRARYAMGDVETALSMAKRGTEHLPKVTGYRALTAAIYARLGRDEEAQREFEVYKSNWPVPITLKGIMYFWDFRDRAVAERFAQDMIRAGRLPPPHRYYRISDDGRLSGKEIRALFFGRTVTGRSVVDRKQLWVERTKDGTMTLRAAYGTFSGKSWVEDELLCSRYDRLFEGWKACAPVFRNLDGGPETMDEYVVFTVGIALPRSPVKE